MKRSDKAEILSAMVAAEKQLDNGSSDFIIIKHGEEYGIKIDVFKLNNK